MAEAGSAARGARAGRRNQPASRQRRPASVVSRRWGAGAPLAEFADARTLVRWNTRLISREASDARPGDLLYYRQIEQRQPDHLMVVVGPSRLDPSAADFIVYHTGPDDRGPGEIRKVRMADLMRHPAPRWRPVPSNRAFIGVFRLVALT